MHETQYDALREAMGIAATVQGSTDRTNTQKGTDDPF